MAFGQVDRIRETARRRRVTNLPRLDGDDRTNERIHALFTRTVSFYLEYIFETTDSTQGTREG